MNEADRAQLELMELRILAQVQKVATSVQSVDDKLTEKLDGRGGVMDRLDAAESEITSTNKWKWSLPATILLAAGSIVGAIIAKGGF